MLSGNVALTGRYVDVTGIDNHQVTDIEVVQAGAYVVTHRGPAILVMNEYALCDQDRTIHLSLQMEHFKNSVNDRSRQAGGLHIYCRRILHTVGHYWWTTIYEDETIHG